MCGHVISSRVVSISHSLSPPHTPQASNWVPGTYSRHVSVLMALVPGTLYQNASVLEALVGVLVSSKRYFSKDAKYLMSKRHCSGTFENLCRNSQRRRIPRTS